MNLEDWQPYLPAQITPLLADIGIPYWIAGGYAMEAFVGTPYRTHSDIDIVIQRAAQTLFRNALASYQFYAADPPGALRPWGIGEYLPRPINDVWVKEQVDGPFVFQLMFLETEKGEWFFKRDAHIRGPLAEFGLSMPDGTPIIAPHIQLLYKAKNVRAKDEMDFQACLPKLNTAQKQWLRAALRHVYPQHSWLEQL